MNPAILDVFHPFQGTTQLTIRLQKITTNSTVLKELENIKTFVEKNYNTTDYKIKTLVNEAKTVTETDLDKINCKLIAAYSQDMNVLNKFGETPSNILFLHIGFYKQEKGTFFSKPKSTIVYHLLQHFINTKNIMGNDHVVFNTSDDNYTFYKKVNKSATNIEKNPIINFYYYSDNVELLILNYNLTGITENIRFVIKNLTKYLSESSTGGRTTESSEYVKILGRKRRVRMIDRKKYVIVKGKLELLSQLKKSLRLK